MDQPVAKHLPRGKGGKELCQLMERAAEILANHDVNRVRKDLGENPATNIWLWGQGHRPVLDSFSKRFGIKAAVPKIMSKPRVMMVFGMLVIAVKKRCEYDVTLVFIATLLQGLTCRVVPRVFV